MFGIIRNNRVREELRKSETLRATARRRYIVDRVALLADGSKFTRSERDKEDMREKARIIINEVLAHHSLRSVLFSPAPPKEK